MNKEEIKAKYFSCIYCLTPLINFQPSEDPIFLTTKCFEGHIIKYNINDFISYRTEQFNQLENITCDKCQSKKNLSFCNEEKMLLCQKCFSKIHKDKSHKINILSRIDNCPKHNKVYFYCNDCKIIFCKDCNEEHFKFHKFSNIKDFFLSESENEKINYIKNKLNYYNYILKYKIFNSKLNSFNYEDKIYKYRQPEILLYSCLLKEYNRRYNKYNNFNILFNLRKIILEKYEKIKKLSFIDFINETKVPNEFINSKNSMINYLKTNYLNFDNISYNNEDKISILIDSKNMNININYFLLLENNNIFVAGNISCYLFDNLMNLKGEIKLKASDDENNRNDYYKIISFIHYKKYQNQNLEIIYAFITSTIYEISIIKKDNNIYSLSKKEYSCKRISHKIDGVIDMHNGDIITCSHMYPVICWRKNILDNFYEHKILTEQKPYIKNAVNIIHLPDDEFCFTSHSWPSITFYKYEHNNDNYKLIKAIKMNCSSIKNTLVLYKDKIIIVGLQFEQICLLNVKNKEIISKIVGINNNYIFCRNCGEIIIKENLFTNIYKYEKGEIVYKGIFKNKLQINIDKIVENKKGELFISENDLAGIMNNSGRINKIFIYHN